MHKAFCTFCNTEFNVSHGGKNDIDRHCSNAGHQNAVKHAKKMVNKHVLPTLDKEELTVPNGPICGTAYVPQNCQIVVYQK